MRYSLVSAVESVYVIALHSITKLLQRKLNKMNMWRLVRIVTICTAKLQAQACISTKSNNPPWVFFTFFKLHKWYQIAQGITRILTTNIVMLQFWLVWYLKYINQDCNAAILTCLIFEIYQPRLQCCNSELFDIWNISTKIVML